MIGNRYPGGGFEVALVDPTTWIANPPAVRVGVMDVAMPIGGQLMSATAIDAVIGYAEFTLD